MQIALVSREIHPYIGGGIAPIVTAAATLLSEVADVTLVTREAYRADHERRMATDGRPPLPRSVRLVWVRDPEPEEVGSFMSFMHAYSARVDRALRDAFPGRGPDMIEFSDYLGEGFVTMQARHTLDPWLEHTLVCVRAHTTSEICAVLDGHMPDDFPTVAVHDAERYAMRHADRLLWSGGDVLETYRRYYGAANLAPDERIPDAFLFDDAPSGSEPPPSDGPLELLYLGRAERRKGVQNLIRAMTSLTRDDVRLSLLGGDTQSGPLQTSMRTQLELMAFRDERVRFLEPVPREEVDQHILEAHAVVMPSLWECWPNVGREALWHNRPILATPVGGLCEMVVPGRTGWLTRDTSVPALIEGINHLADHREEVDAVIRSGAVREHAGELTDAGAFVERYRRLAGSRVRRPARASRDPLVSVVVPYFKLDGLIDETLDSVLAQTHRNLEVLIVNDGSLRREDGMLYSREWDRRIRVVTQANSGLSAARNQGAVQARGRYVLPLDADDLIDETFVARCVDALERDPELAYVTTWVRYMEPDGTPMDDEGGGYMPLGNWSRLIERNNVGGTCSAVLRRRIFELGFRWSPDLTSYEDWLFYLQLGHAGHHGAVIPERLFHYRVRAQSMMRTDGAPRTELIVGEIAAHVRESEVQWVSSRH